MQVQNSGAIAGLFLNVIAVLLTTTFSVSTVLAQESTEVNKLTESAKSQIVNLLDRPEGLYAAEFQRIKARFATLNDLLSTAHSTTELSEVLVEIGQIYMREARITGEHPYYYPAAFNILQQALIVSPQNYEALVSLGSVQMSLHKFSAAKTLAQSAIKIAPNRAVAYGILCDASLELGDYSAAVNACDKMVNIRPDLRSYARVSYLREVHGDLKGAMDAMQLAVKAGQPGSEENAWAQTQLADLYMRNGNITMAQQLYHLAATQRPNYPFALAGLARVQAALGNPERAIVLLDQAAALAPEFGFLQAKADLKRAAGQNRTADSLVAVIEAMLAEDEAAGHAMDREIALMYCDHDLKLAEAERRVVKDLQKRPQNVDAQHSMAIVALARGNYSLAQKHMQNALRLGGSDPVMLAHAGLIEAELGNTALAKDYLDRAVTANPFLPVLLKAEVLKTLNNLS